MKNPKSLLVWYFGLYEMKKLEDKTFTRVMYIIVMGNVFTSQ